MAYMEKHRGVPLPCTSVIGMYLKRLLHPPLPTIFHRKQTRKGMVFDKRGIRIKEKIFGEIFISLRSVQIVITDIG